MTELLTGPDAATAGSFLADPRVQRAIQLVWHEAALLDAKEYEAWQDLYTDDAIYVIPIERDTEEFADTLNMVFDDARMRRMRVARLTEGYSLSAVDAARTVRTVSRFTVASVSDTEVRLRSAQVLVSFKRDEFAVLGAELDHVIVLATGGDRIGRKVIRLLNSDSAVNASGYLL
jgi:3-phenylpropionate/cinnamic acid dioxygenase small subunit